MTAAFVFMLTLLCLRVCLPRENISSYFEASSFAIFTLVAKCFDIATACLIGFAYSQSPLWKSTCMFQLVFPRGVPNSETFLPKALGGLGMENFRMLGRWYEANIIAAFFHDIYFILRRLRQY